LARDIKDGDAVNETEHNSDLVAQFHKVYDNLPLRERTQVVLVLGNEPISWEIARNEIINHTKTGNEIIQKLFELKII